MFNDELLEKAKNDPIHENIAFCEDCMDHVLEFIVYIRQLENAQVVAKDALDTINVANAKLTKDIEWLQDELDKTRKALSAKEQKTLKDRMMELDNRHHAYVNRGKL